MAKAYRKRRYEAAFITKLTDPNTENAETLIHLDFVVACGYATDEQVRPLIERTEEVRVMLNSMMNNPGKWVTGPRKKQEVASGQLASC